MIGIEYPGFGDRAYRDCLRKVITLLEEVIIVRSLVAVRTDVNSKVFVRDGWVVDGNLDA